MTTARQVVNGAAEELGVKTAEITLESEDAQVIFNRMNDMLTEWADIGITPQFNEVANLDDTIEVDRSAVAAVKYNLALRCSAVFPDEVPPFLAALADDSLSRLMASTAFIGDVDYPDTLPLGSGNDCPSVASDNRFFPAGGKDNF